MLYPTLAIMTIASWVAARSNRGGWAREAHGAVLLLLITGLAGITLGAIQNNPGWAQAGTVWVGGIIVWVSFGLGASRFLKPILTSIAIGVLIVGTAVTFEVGNYLGLLPRLVPQWFSELQDTFVNGDLMSSGIKFYGLSTLAAGTPLVVALAISPNSPYSPRRSLCIWAAVASCVGALLSGRRGILLVAILSPLILLAWRRFVLPRRKAAAPKWVPPTVAGVVLTTVGAVATLPGLSSRVLEMFADTAALAEGADAGGASDVVRVEQASRLLHAWGTNPIFGSGFGATLPDGFIRSVERPWAFELQYHLLLFNVGLVGLAAVIAAVALIVPTIRRAATERPEMAAVICAISTSCTALVVANATNPYLQAVGHGWPLGLVIGVAALAGRSRPKPPDAPVTPPVPPKPD